MISPGFGRCAECDEPVLFALAVSGDVFAFDAAFEDGPWGIAWDVTRTPRCRPVRRGASLRDREYLYRQHSEACPASAGPVAPVVPMQHRMLARRTPIVPERRAASAH